MTKLPDSGDDSPRVLPPGFDTTVAHASRVYDYWLGGCFL
jgi:S-adenosyl methyltransferase